MSSDDDENSYSPIPRRRYKRYKSDSTAPIPLRTLNRWRTSGFFSNDDTSRSENYHEESSIDENDCATNVINNLTNDDNFSSSDVSDIDSVSNKSTDDRWNESDQELASDHDDEEVNDNDDECPVDYENDDDFEDVEGDHDNLIEIEEIIHEDIDQSNMIFPNSTMSVDECVLCLLKLYIKHNITKAALKDILKMQLKFLPEDNEMPKTLFKLFQYAKNIAPPTKFIKNYYCKKCLFGVDIEISGKKQIEKCSLFKKEKISDIGFFHAFDVSDQIEFLFEHNNLAEKLKLTRSQNDGNISDITDGTEYIRVNARNNRGTYGLTLILNTDGLSLVKSAKSHCWPLMFTIAELPLNIRDKYIIIIGLWYDDSCKPSMNLFLKPIFNKLKQCFVTGIDWINPKTRETIKSKIVAPIMIADAPARAQVQNIMSFNGRYGCNICEIRTVKSKPIAGLKTSRIFPYKIDCRLRTGKRMEAQAKMLLKKNTKIQIRGVKGYSILSCLPLIDLGKCVLPEFMHSVLLGVVKQVFGLWFGKKSPYSLKSKITEVDDFMLRIRPPQSFSRLPRKLSQYNLFKASECYNFLLFYSLPLLAAYLPEIYVQHWLLLVKAIFNLVKSTVTVTDLEESNDLLKLFVSQIEELYGDRQLSYNVHQLLHLALCVKRWGPLQGTSAFSFENFNGYI
ncbi:GSCOCG00012284001-RA-CDS, partial [Cotesia congregata]